MEKEIIMSTVVEKMEKHLNREQLSILERVLSIALHGCKVSKEKYEVIPHDNTDDVIVR